VSGPGLSRRLGWMPGPGVSAAGLTCSMPSPGVDRHGPRRRHPWRLDLQQVRLARRRHLRDLAWIGG
jgi:hypothetical protein